MLVLPSERRTAAVVRSRSITPIARTTRGDKRRSEEEEEEEEEENDADDESGAPASIPKYVEVAEPVVDAEVEAGGCVVGG